MKILALFALIVLLLGFGGDALAAVGGRMPNLSALGYVVTLPLVQFDVCKSGKPVYMIGFNKKGREKAGEFDAAAFYENPKDPFNRPFALVIWVTGGSEIRAVYVDKNRDGIIDAEGQPGDPGVGQGPCDVLDGIAAP